MTSRALITPRLELLRSAPLDCWIAVSGDETRILASGRTLIEADSAAKSSGEEGYFLLKTPTAWLPRAFARFR